MYRIVILNFLIFNISILYAQNIDLTSVDDFFKVTSVLMENKEVSKSQWNNFFNSGCYKNISDKGDIFLLNKIKHSMTLVFNNNSKTKLDSVISTLEKEINIDQALLTKKLILKNYIDIKKNYVQIKNFRDKYNFESLRQKSIKQLSYFLQSPIDTTIKLKPLSFFFLYADGKDTKNAICIDFNLIYKMTEQQKINFIAHEFFHNYRSYFENHEFNYKSDLNFLLDMIQNEGIADQIDKTQGYKSYYADVLKSPELCNIMVNLYNNAEKDLSIIQDIIVKYSKNEITENEMIDKLLEVYKYNGHAIGFFMSNEIIKAGFKDEMIKTFYNPYEFYKLYNIAANKNNTLKLSNSFMKYLNKITKKHYN